MKWVECHEINRNQKKSWTSVQLQPTDIKQEQIGGRISLAQAAKRPIPENHDMYEMLEENMKSE